MESIKYSGQKKKVNGPEIAKYFSLLKRVYSFWHYCIMVGVLHYVLWLEDDLLSRSTKKSQTNWK